MSTSLRFGTFGLLHRSGDISKRNSDEVDVQQDAVESRHCELLACEVRVDRMLFVVDHVVRDPQDERVLLEGDGPAFDSLKKHYSSLATIPTLAPSSHHHGAGGLFVRGAVPDSRCDAIVSDATPTRARPHVTWMDIWVLVQINEVRIDLMSFLLIHFRPLWGHLQPIYLDLLHACNMLTYGHRHSQTLSFWALSHGSLK
jgi:hypothetical protein